MGVSSLGYLLNDVDIDVEFWYRHLQGLQTLLSPEQAKEWGDLYEATDAFTDGWFSAGTFCFTEHAFVTIFCHNLLRVICNSGDRVEM